MKPFEMTIPVRRIAGQKDNPVLGINLSQQVTKLLKLKRGDWVRILIEKIKI